MIDDAGSDWDKCSSNFSTLVIGSLVLCEELFMPTFSHSTMRLEALSRQSLRIFTYIDRLEEADSIKTV